MTRPQTQADTPALRDPPLGDNQKHASRNFRLGVVAGMFVALSRDFFHPQLILAGFIYALTKSTLLVALITIINKGCILAPQLLISNFLEHSPRRRPQFVVLPVARTVIYLLLILAMWLIAAQQSTAAIFLFGSSAESVGGIDFV